MTALARSFSNLVDVSTEDLRRELAQALEVTAENLVWLARLWRELERRGEDLRELRSGIRNFLPLIADGRLDAQAAVQFAGNLTVLRALASLPIAEQRRLASGGTVETVVMRGDQVVAKRMKIDEMSAALVRQVFATGRVRSEAEQRLIVTTLKPERQKLARKRPYGSNAPRCVMRGLALAATLAALSAPVGFVQARGDHLVAREQISFARDVSVGRSPMPYIEDSGGFYSSVGTAPVFVESLPDVAEIEAGDNDAEKSENNAYACRYDRMEGRLCHINLGSKILLGAPLFAIGIWIGLWGYWRSERSRFAPILCAAALLCGSLVSVAGLMLMAL